MPLEKAALPLFYAAFFESGLHTLMNVRTVGRRGCYYQEF